MSIPTYRVEVRTIDGSLGTIDREGGEYAFAQTAPVDPRLCGDLREANAERARITERLAACWNALAGYNPAALAALVEAAEEVLTYMDMCNDKGDLERNLRTALTAFRAGKAS